MNTTSSYVDYIIEDRPFGKLCFKWGITYSLIPVRSYKSHKLIWFKKAYRGIITIWHPTGNCTKDIVRWLTITEFILYALKDEL